MPGSTIEGRSSAAVGSMGSNSSTVKNSFQSSILFFLFQVSPRHEHCEYLYYMHSCAWDIFTFSLKITETHNFKLKSLFFNKKICITELEPELVCTPISPLLLSQYCVATELFTYDLEHSDLKSTNLFEICTKIRSHNFKTLVPYPD